jgi:hypothetical protein
MNTRRTALHTALLGLAMSPLLFVAGCATAPPTADRMAIAPMGTLSTFHRKSSGSLGNFDSKVVWTHAPTTWQGKPAILFSAPQQVSSVHDPAGFAVLANVSADGKPLMSFDPPVDYVWPLAVGKAWTTQYTVTVHATGAKLPLRRDYRVEAFETVTVPAGSFKAWKVSWKDSTGETETRWFSPEAGLATIKRRVDRPATHPQGAGVLDGELVSHVPPPR